MGKGGGSGKSEFESLFKEESTKYHEMVAVAVLRLYGKHLCLAKNVVTNTCMMVAVCKRVVSMKCTFSGFLSSS